jgi:hypothetical protein
MNTVRAKFHCASKIELVYPNGAPVCSYVFYLVASGNAENKAVFEASPAGKLELASADGNLFEIGQEYYLDFTPSA